MNKVTCETVMRELTNFMEGQLEHSSLIEINTHIRSCSRCTILLDTMKKMLKVFADEEAFGDALNRFEGVKAVDLPPKKKKHPKKK